MGRILYWAYGSNLNVQAMQGRCPDARRVAPLTLAEGRLVFRGVADVVVTRGAVIPGALWEISRQDERRLDAYEGVAARLYLKRWLLLEHNGVERRCLFYQMTTTRGVMPPSTTYFETILRGYDDWGLDPEPLHSALHSAWEDKEITPFMAARHERRGRPEWACPPRRSRSGRRTK